jgi:hypothetical protein
MFRKLDLFSSSGEGVGDNQIGSLPSAAAVLLTLVPGSSTALLNKRTSWKRAYISAGIGFWPYVDWNFCSFK